MKPRTVEFMALLGFVMTVDDILRGFLESFHVHPLKIALLTLLVSIATNTIWYTWLEKRVRWCLKQTFLEVGIMTRIYQCQKGCQVRSMIELNKFSHCKDHLEPWNVLTGSEEPHMLEFH